MAVSAHGLTAIGRRVHLLAWFATFISLCGCAAFVDLDSSLSDAGTDGVYPDQPRPGDAALFDSRAPDGFPTCGIPMPGYIVCNDESMRACLRWAQSRSSLPGVIASCGVGYQRCLLGTCDPELVPNICRCGSESSGCRADEVCAVVNPGEGARCVPACQ